MSRDKNSFLDLMNGKKITIPIIQRDYAQGREEEKAKKVRERLIENWIDILEDPSKSMDFNFIYGEENNNEFLPVDGQQRLTSLYLLHWYLAYRTGNETEIKKWNFDYKTRNSASEFFNMLKNNPNDAANELYVIVITQDSKKLDKIKNKKWFKMKWENDPTINACLSFLCALSEKFNNKECVEYWDRLANGEDPAIYFTYLPEESSENTEIRAAQTYTRMNARGKALTDFENIKAMIDELEKNNNKFIISESFDSIYINYLYNKYKNDNDLFKITKCINDSGLTLFKNVFYIYSVAVKREIIDLSKEYYENTMYRLSQKKEKDEKINEYLKMLKAVLEVVCNSECSCDCENELFEHNISNNKMVIAFILFVYNKWEYKDNPEKQISINKEIAKDWKDFEQALLDLNYDGWNCSTDTIYAVIISKMLQKFTTPQDYFIRHDFESDSPFENWGILVDLKCRVLECKIMWCMIKDEKISEDELRKFKDNQQDKRLGYLFYLCGCLSDEAAWRLDDRENYKLPETADKIKDYIEIIDKLSPWDNLGSNKNRAIYAYASQCDPESKQLRSVDEVNKCTDSHIWNLNNLQWGNEQYNALCNNCKRQMDNFRVMLDMLIGENKDIDKLYSKLQEKVHTGYEDCWLRFVLQYTDAASEILKNKLVDDYGKVKVEINNKSYDPALYTFLLYEGYKAKYNVNMGMAYQLTDKRWYEEADKKIMYNGYLGTCTFEADKEYKHSGNIDLSLTPRKKVNNTDLIYETYFTANWTEKEGYLSFEYDRNNNTFVIKRYAKSGVEDGKIKFSIETITVGADKINEVKNHLNKWKEIINDIVSYPSNNTDAQDRYDIWLELRYGEIKDNNAKAVKEYISKKVEENISEKFDWGEAYKYSSGSRKKHTWEENFSLPEPVKEEDQLF